MLKSANFSHRCAMIKDLQSKNFQVKICFSDGARLFLTCTEEVSVATLHVITVLTYWT